MIGGVVSSVLCTWGWFGTAGEGSVGISGLISFVRSAFGLDLLTSHSLIIKSRYYDFNDSTCIVNISL